jgi:uncharacterized protein (UPF0264 family)
MTGLLVSVRDSAEAEMALAAGVDLIDVKEPSRGSLGAASPDVWQRVLDVCGNVCPVSAALGELLAPGVKELASQARGLTYAKVGLAGCAAASDWSGRWRECLEALPSGVAAVAVAYADSERAVAPRAEEVLEHALQYGCRALLLDTYQKQQGDLFAFLTHTRLRGLVAQAHSRGLLVVLAGSIGRDSISAVKKLGADYLAVRGAVCRGTRDGPADLLLMQQLVDELASTKPIRQLASRPASELKKTF